MQLAALGLATPTMLAFNTEVTVETKKWEEFQGHWRPRRKRAWVRGPDPTMSLTSGGHYLVDEEGRFFRAAHPRPLAAQDVPGAGPEVLLDEAARGPGPLALGDAPAHRVRGKGPALHRQQATTDHVQDEHGGGGMMEFERDEEDKWWKIDDEAVHARLRRGEELGNQEFRRIDMKKDANSGEMVALKAISGENEELWSRIRKMDLADQEAAKNQCQEEADTEHFLQTKTISLQEVRSNMEPWLESMKAEYNQLLDNGAIREIRVEEVPGLLQGAKSEGRLTEQIPGKAVFTRKAGSGKYKTRIVACGNMMMEREASELYSSGLDATQLRVLLRHGALEEWLAGTLDIRTAFLLAPTSQRELIVVSPPKVLQDAGVVPVGVAWLVTGAMYGLTTAPRDWSGYRDGRWNPGSGWSWRKEER